MVLQKSETWNDGVYVGLGHGGTEAIILGVLAALAFVNMIAYRYIDLSAIPSIPLGQLDLAKQQAMESGVTNTDFRCGDAVDLPHGDETFSIVISKSAFHHYSEYHSIFGEMKRCCGRQGRISIQDIAAYDDKRVNAFFESFERLVDASHKAACSKSFILDLYRQYNVDIVSAMEITIDLNLNDYLDHALRSEKDAIALRQWINAGLKDPAVKKYFSFKENDLFFKRNVFLILGQKD